MINPQIPKTIQSEFEADPNVDLDVDSRILNPSLVRQLFTEYQPYRLIKLKSIPFTVRDPEWASRLLSAFKRSGYRQHECAH